MTDMPRDEFVNGIANQLMAFNEAIDQNVAIAQSISATSYEELTMDPVEGRSTWDGLQNWAAANVDLMQAFKEMIKMSGMVLSDESTMDTVERIVDQQIAQNHS